MLEQCVLLSSRAVITPEQLTFCPSLTPGGEGTQQGGDLHARGRNLLRPGVSLAEIGRELVVKTLDRTDWSVTRSAKLLGISRDMMRSRIKKMGLVRPEV